MAAGHRRLPAARPGQHPLRGRRAEHAGLHARNPARYLLSRSGARDPLRVHRLHASGRGLETIDEVRPGLTASFVAAGPTIAERETRLGGQVAGAGTRGLRPGGARRDRARQRRRGARPARRGLHARRRAAAGRDGTRRQVRRGAQVRPRSIRATERAVGACAMRRAGNAREPPVVDPAPGRDRAGRRLRRDAPAHVRPAHQPLVPGDRREAIGPNELVALDTDIVGCHGYYCDFSRTFHAGPDAPRAAQNELYRHAHEQVHHNMATASGRRLIPRVRGPGVDHPGALRGQPLLRLRARLRDDRRVPLPMPRAWTSRTPATTASSSPE